MLLFLAKAHNQVFVKYDLKKPLFLNVYSLEKLCLDLRHTFIHERALY